ncbi:MAG: hypothetical protein VX589_17920 [Myxococcota bacterium]|nr:hypothetical protein [Myxococcota bacterium]
MTRTLFFASKHTLAAIFTLSLASGLIGCGQFPGGVYDGNDNAQLAGGQAWSSTTGTDEPTTLFGDDDADALDKDDQSDWTAPNDDDGADVPGGTFQGMDVNGQDEPEDATGVAPGTQSGKSGHSALRNGVTAGLAIPSQTMEATKQTAEIALNALYCASYLTGAQAVVATGTLTLNGPGAHPCPINGLAFAYTQTPSDRLVVKLDGRQDFSVKFNAADGRLIDGPAEFLNSSHRLDFEFESSNLGQVRIESYKQGGESEVRLVGQLTLGDDRFSVDLSGRFNTAFETGGGGTQQRQRYTMTGTVDGDGVTAQINESWDYELVCTRQRQRTTGTRCMSSAKRRFSNRWQQQGRTYVVQDGFTNGSFRDGKPNHAEFDTFWAAGGVLLEDGQPIGELKFLPDPAQAHVGFFMVMDDGTYPVQLWNAY